jgi:hypothetical protein
MTATLNAVRHALAHPAQTDETDLHCHVPPASTPVTVGRQYTAKVKVSLLGKRRVSGVYFQKEFLKS